VPLRTNARGRMLPTVDQSGFFGIRLESVGGYGAHAAGRILAEAGVVHQGLSGSHFSSYGSEKKGSPVTSYIRFGEPERPVRTSAPIDRPHLVAVFHAALLKIEPVLHGLRGDGTVVINTPLAPEAARRAYQLPGSALGTIDAAGIGIQTGSRPNMAMLGAVCRFLPFLEAGAVRTAIEAVFGRKGEKVVAANLEAFEQGWQEVQTFDGEPDCEPQPVQRPAPRFGYLHAPAGGVIVEPGNTVRKDLTAFRQGFLPQFLREKCIDCTLCDLACPDMAFVWSMGTDGRGRPALVLDGIDYQYCKGCLKCIEACPTDALVQVREQGATGGTANETGTGPS
jgi:pyruvate ferredoxin oxidoreductase gamma subunit